MPGPSRRAQIAIAVMPGAEAIGAFETTLELRPQDAASSVMVGRCRQQLEKPTSEGWDGTTVARTK